MLRAVAMVWAALGLWAGQGLAQPVTLTSPSGGTTLSGEALGYDGRFLRVQSPQGEVTLPLNRFSCTGPGCPQSEFPVARVTISGAGAATGLLLPPLIRAFAGREGLALRMRRVAPDERVYGLWAAQGRSLLLELTLREGDSPDQGIGDLLAGRADLALSDRLPQPDETARMLAAGLGDFRSPGSVRVLALDPVVPVVSARSPLRDLPLDRLAQVLAGPGDGAAPARGRVALHVPEQMSGIAGGAFGVPVAALRHRYAGTLVAALRRDPGAIGFLSRRDAGDLRILPLRDGCGQMLRADRATVRAGLYPLAAPVFLLVPERRQPDLMRRFLAYIRSPHAQPVIAAAGYVDQRVLPAGTREQAAHLRRMRAQQPDDGPLRAEAAAAHARLRGLRWLALSFGFQADGRTLTPVARSAVQVLATALAAGQYGGERLVLVGFSDGTGDAAANLELSRTRAEILRQAIRAAVQAPDGAGPEFETLAVGEVLPVACEQTGRGRSVNRRVELWLAPGSDE